jgi:hypothetical protein
VAAGGDAGIAQYCLLGPEPAGLDQVQGLNAGLISQNGDPPYTVTGGPAVRP